MDTLYTTLARAAEEAAMVTNRDMIGRDGNRMPALPPSSRQR